MDLPQKPAHTRSIPAQHHERVFDHKTRLGQFVYDLHVREDLVVGCLAGGEDPLVGRHFRLVIVAQRRSLGASLPPLLSGPMLTAGIVGLPNVGKSTLFNALTRSHKAPAENYPFCTIEPNLGVVTVPDARLEQLGNVVRVPNRIPTTIEFVDIAGLVKGASRGEGLGNHFLSHIREVHAIIHVVRCFEDPDIHHVTGNIDPLRDIEIVTTELVLADLEALRRRREKISKEFKGGDKHAIAENHVLDKLEPHLNAGKPAISLNLTREEWELARPCGLLTAKPTIYAANVRESDLSGAGASPHVARVREYARTHHTCDTVVVCAQLESDLADLTPEEARQYLEELGVTEAGVATLIRQTYRLLDLRTFFTFNEKEVRAWTIRSGETAAKAAGSIHTDFERGFIKAECVSWEDLVKSGTVGHARETGHYRIEGRDYAVRDGDVLLFKFQV
jgi:GTP-binding protein YchF